MELFHIHLLGVKDRMYKPKSEIIIDPNKYNNRLYNRVYNANVCVSGDIYTNMINNYNDLLYSQCGMILGDKINMGELIKFACDTNCLNRNELRKMLQDTACLLLKAGINYRELAMEEFRKNNCPEKPSRLHSLYACTEKGIEFWSTQIQDGESDIYRIEVEDQPFVSNDNLLPDNSLSYGDKIQASYKYFHPKNKDLDGIKDEYLVQGRVRLKEKVGEIRRQP